MVALKRGVGVSSRSVAMAMSNTGPVSDVEDDRTMLSAGHVNDNPVANGHGAGDSDRRPYPGHRTSDVYFNGTGSMPGAAPGSAPATLINSTSKISSEFGAMP